MKRFWQMMEGIVWTPIGEYRAIRVQPVYRLSRINGRAP